jgi:hypothetical protein
MSSPSTAVRAALTTQIQTEFADEFADDGWTIADDKFGRSKGMEIPETQAAIAIYPELERARPGHILELIVTVVVQFHLGYAAEPDETIVRDPGVIEAYGQRFRASFSEPGDANYWFAHLLQVSYPDDPTGNKTRFEAVVEARALNEPAAPS